MPGAMQSRAHQELMTELRKASHLPTFFFTPLCMETRTCQACSQLSVWTHGGYPDSGPHTCDMSAHPLTLALLCTPRPSHTCPPCTRTLCTHTHVYTSHSRACLSSSPIHVHMRHHAHTSPQYLLVHSGTDTPSRAIDMLTHTQATYDS